MHAEAGSVFADQGFVLWPTPIEQGLLADLRDAVASIQEKAQRKSLPSELEQQLVYEKDLPAHKRSGVGSDAVGDSIFIIGDPARFDGVFNRLLEDASVVQAATTLLGEGQVIVHFMNVTIKNPVFGRAIGWHRDYPNEFFCTKESSFIRLMICLDGMSEASGATCFDAGSHGISDEEARQQKMNGKWPGPDPENTITVQCDPGRIVAIHPKVLHGGGMNTGTGMRRNVILQIGALGAEPTAHANESLTGIVIGAKGCREYLNR